MLKKLGVIAAIVAFWGVNAGYAQFSPLTGTGPGGSYVAGDLFGFQTAEQIRLNFNDLDSRVDDVEADYLTTDSTSTLTNKTLNVESTGNVLTITDHLWFAAARCDNATATSPEWSFPTSSPGVPACQTGTNTQFGTMDFADSANLSAQLHVRLPADWTGTIDALFKWFTSATSGDVVWQLATICRADGETSDPAFNAASTVTDTAKGTTLQQNDAAITGVTITGCAAGEVLYVKVFRDSAHASDSLAATARLVGLELTYRRAM